MCHSKTKRKKKAQDVERFRKMNPNINVFFTIKVLKGRVRDPWMSVTLLTFETKHQLKTKS